MKLIIVVLSVVLLVNSAALAFPSKALKKVWDIPLTAVGYEVIRSYNRNGIHVDEVQYLSRSYKGKPSKIFGYYCYPRNIKGKLPAILISHGGGGTADLGRTIRWAKRGYAVLTIDLPGKGDQRWNSRSTGPNMEVPVLLRTKPDPTHNYLVHAVAATRNGITFLRQQQKVDPKRVGMVGLSWGGVITLLTNGQDKRLKTAVNVFGAGYIPEGCTWQERFDIKSAKDLADWNNYIDPRNFLKTQHAPILFMTGTNDHCYYLPTFQKSYEDVKVEKKLTLIPNLRHKFTPAMQEIVLSWLDNKLKGKGSFPRIQIYPIFKKADKSKLIIPVEAHTPGKVKAVTLHYTVGEPARWTRKKWETMAKPYYEEGIYYFGIPMSMVKPEMMFYVNVRDNKGALASSPIRSLFKVNVFKEKETYAVSSPIKKINIHEPPLQVLGIKDLPKLIMLYFSKKTKTYQLLMKPRAGTETTPQPKL